MLQPVPAQVPDPKDAVLWSLFDRLQKIDENQGSRIAFATAIAYNQHFGIDTPAFQSELNQLREILKIPIPEAQELKEAVTSRSDDGGCVDETTMREL